MERKTNLRNEELGVFLFLVKSVFSACVIFWICAFLAESLFKSREEKYLHPIIRLGLAYMLLFAWFIGAWQFMPIQYAWLAGIMVFIAYKAKDFSEISDLRRILERTVQTYGYPFAFYFLLVNLFFAPIILNGNYGPFGEGGGDVSLYADAPKCLVDRNLPVYGVKSVISNLSKVINEPSANIPQVKTIDRILKADPKDYAPPVADYAVYCATVLNEIGVTVYPSGMFSFLADSTNYHVYYGIMAFYYAMIIMALWAFFVSFGAIPAITASIIAFSSHGLISALYNHYQSQTICILILALLINAAMHVRLFSFSGFKAYVPCLLFLSFYMMFIPLVIPVLILAIFNWEDRPAKNEINAEYAASGLKTSVLTSIARYMAVSLFVAILFVAFPVLLLDLYINIRDTFLAIINPILIAIAHVHPGSVKFLPKFTLNAPNSTFFGNPLSYFSIEVFSFIFGVLSQQHYAPFATVPAYIYPFIIIALCIGAIILVSGFASVIYLVITKDRLPAGNAVNKYYYALYGVISCVFIPYLFLARQTLYTQAKGSQNLLIFTFILMILPYAMHYALQRKGLVKKKAVIVMMSMLMMFEVSLLLPRVAYTAKMASRRDRSGILEPSYFSEAKRIRKEDSDPLVLFEPRNSFDVYVSIQPFSGSKMVPTRHLLSVKSIVKEGNIQTETLIADDFLSTRELPHLWTIGSHATGTRKTFYGDFNDYEWKAEKIIDSKHPRAIFSGANYESFLSERPLSASREDVGMFTYIRNGATSLFAPPGKKYEVDVTISPRTESEYSAMESDMMTRWKAEKPPYGRNISSDGAFLRMKFELEPSNEPRLVHLMRYSGECWVHLMINGQKVKG